MLHCLILVRCNYAQLTTKELQSSVKPPDIADLETAKNRLFTFLGNGDFKGSHIML